MTSINSQSISPPRVMTIEQVPNIPMFRQNTAAFIHELPEGDLSNVDGDSAHVRVQVLTNAGALDRDKQVAVVKQFTDIVGTRSATRAWRSGRGCCSPRPSRAGGASTVAPTPMPSWSPRPVRKLPN